MKRTLSYVVICIIAATLAGCAPLVDDADIPEDFTVYASFYPIYALSALIIDDIPGITLHQLVQPQDGCLRSYALSDWDISLAANAHAVILGGRGLEAFAPGFEALGGSGPAVITAMSALSLAVYGEASGAGGRLSIAGIELEDEPDHFTGENPWLFLSAEGAIHICEAITSGMLVLDEPYAHKYVANLESAKERLSALALDMRAQLEGARADTPVAILHEGLDYMATELGLNTVCVIRRESGVEPDAMELEAMLTALSDSGARVLLIEKQAPLRLTRELEHAGFNICLIDTLSSGREEMGADGYFTAMLDNARRLGLALGGG